MGLHVLLDIGLLGKGAATCNALEGLLPGVAVETAPVITLSQGGTWPWPGSCRACNKGPV